MEEPQVEIKPKVAFVCVHNTCRSQIAEALGKYYAKDVFDSYSAGTEVGPRIDGDAVRLVKEVYGIDMERAQYPKSIDELPDVDVKVSMGCGVSRPHLNAKVHLDYALADPTGRDYDFFKDVIAEIGRNIRDLADRLKRERTLPSSSQDCQQLMYHIKDDMTTEGEVMEAMGEAGKPLPERSRRPPVWTRGISTGHSRS